MVYSLISYPGSSDGKESTCNSEDPGSSRGSGRYAREGIGYSLQYSGACLVAQLIKNLPAMRETFPGLGRSPGEGEGYPLQYSWASLVVQLVKNPPAMQEILVQFLGREDPLEKG